MRRALSRFARLKFPNTSLHVLVRELPLRALLPLALAIVLLFSVMGPVTDLIDGARQPLWVVLVNCVLGGAIGLGYAFGAMRRKPLLFVLAAIAHGAWVVAARRFAGHLTLLPPSEVRGRLTFDALLILAAMTGSYAFFLRFINVTAARYLRIRAEIDLAHDIHQVLVPSIDTRIGGFAFYGRSEPSGEVGGDLVDVVELSGRGWFGYVADVSGHGVSSGVVMGMFKSALRMRLRQPGSLAALLEDLNAVLLPLKSRSMYVTLACVRASDSGALEFAVAGHLPILRIARDGSIEEITTPQIPIGMFEDFRFTAGTLSCAAGDVLALITDGLTEVFDARDRELGMDAIKRVLHDARTLPLPEIADRVISAARAHGVQLDDQTLLLARAD
jgi:serine phosphatase RsbU (regulator of sigma subunit)